MPLGRTAILAILTASGCSGQDGAPAEENASGGEEARPAAAAGTAAGRGAEPSAEVTAEPARAEGGAGAEPPVLPVTIKEARLLVDVAPDRQLELRSHREGNDELAVHIRNLHAYCDPLPKFEARAVEQELELHLKRPDRIGCMGPQSLKLRIEVPKAARIERVRIHDSRGTELAASEVGGRG